MEHTTVIAVFCYKRAGKLRLSMEALLKNPECASMDAIFFCDGHKGEQDRKGVEETRRYVDSLTGFRNVYKHYRERNVSTGPNFMDGFAWLCSHYDQFIVVEDDLVVSSNYIRYMLEALAFYRREPSVFCISGFNFPIRVHDYGYDTVMCDRFCSYGWASWSDRVNKVTFHKEGLRQMMDNSPGFRRRLNREGLDLYRMLVRQVSGTISTWDIQMQVHVSENRLKVVYPVQSKTTNIGFDEESTNTFGVDYLKTPLDDGNQRDFSFCDAGTVSDILQRQVRKPYGLNALASRKIINTAIKVFHLF